MRRTVGAALALVPETMVRSKLKPSTSHPMRTGCTRSRHRAHRAPDHHCVVDFRFRRPCRAGVFRPAVSVRGAKGRVGQVTLPKLLSPRIVVVDEVHTWRNPKTKLFAFSTRRPRESHDGAGA